MQQKPNENEQEGTSFDLNTIPQPQLAGHAWRQQGTMLICSSCPFTHSTTIYNEHGLPAVGWQLYGIDDNGYPRFRKLEY